MPTVAETLNLGNAMNHTDELYAEIRNIFPNAELGETDDGELVIYTNYFQTEEEEIQREREIQSEIDESRLDCHRDSL